MPKQIADFQGSKQEYELVRKALEHFHSERGIASTRLMNLVEAFRDKKFPNLYAGKMPDVGVLDRLRGVRRKRGDEGPNRSYNESFVGLLWVYFQVECPDLIKPITNIEHDHPFYYHMLRFYDADEGKSAGRMATAVGRYAVYHFSQLFRGPPQGVVLGELRIIATEGGKPFTAMEHEFYDGVRFDPDPASEDSVGYCIYKHDSIVVVLAEKKKNTPKWYLFDHPKMSGKHGIETMTGHMCELASGQDLFTSPVVARHITESDPIEFNIYNWTEIRSDVMNKLLVNPLSEFYERRKTE